MTELILIRHGETDYNKQKLVQGLMDNPLNSEGKKQAEGTAHKLKNFNISFDKIISSPLVRAQMTAQIIKENLHIGSDIIIEPGFIERDFGIYEGFPVLETIAKITEEGFTCDQYENDLALKLRVKATALELAKNYPNQRLIIIAHAHAIKALLAETEPKNYNFRTLLSNCSINIFQIDKNIITIKAVNL
ncbi:MAG: histidine phosphatase family protein [Erysipelotrichales bacterium]|nr:histidine phosphatase family protein [Erysipelotrichales bacterium]